MREAARGIAWVAEERLHLTMKFFGEQPENAVDALRDSLRGAAAGHDPLVLRLGGLGAFPNLRAPRVVWMGVDAEPKLELLHHDVERACADLGHALDARAFRPHITLGRSREPLARPAARSLADAARAVRYAGEAPVRTLDLMASVLAPPGPNYTVLAAIPLGGA